MEVWLILWFTCDDLSVVAISDLLFAELFNVLCDLIC